jgi:hypothetical protein
VAGFARRSPRGPLVRATTHKLRTGTGRALAKLDRSNWRNALPFTAWGDILCALPEGS